MTILAIETSTACGSVALWRGAGQCVAVEFDAGRGGHSAVLFGELQRLLAGGTHIDRVAVGCGPGSYTGLRVGIAAALGIAAGRRIPLLGVPSVLTLSVESSDYRVVGDAGRGGCYLLDVRGRRWDGEVQIVPVDLLPDALGRGGLGVGPIVAACAFPHMAGIRVCPPRAALVAALVCDGVGREAAPGLPVEPIYLRAACAAPPRSVSGEGDA